MPKPKISKKELRNTGLVVGTALAVLGALQLILHGRLAHGPWIPIFFVAAAVLILLGLLAPAVLRPFHFLWMKFSEALGWVMNRVLLGILFFVFMTLTACVLRAIRRDVLRKNFSRRHDSYWVPRPEGEVRPERYERQF